MFLPATGVLICMIASASNTTTFTINEHEAFERFNLLQRLDSYHHRKSVANSRHRVDLVDGDLHVPGDLLLDPHSAQPELPSDSLKQWATTSDDSVGLIVTGKLTVDGAIINSNRNRGPFLLVLGDLRARALFAGGAEIVIEGKAEFEDAVVGCYNDGYVRFLDELSAPFVISEDHSFDIREPGATPYFDYFNGDGDPEELLALLHADLRPDDIEELDAEGRLLPRMQRALPIAASSETAHRSPHEH